MYDCGYRWLSGTPWCGFRSYLSADLIHWIDLGVMFDASDPYWQRWCGAGTMGCFDPRMAHNKRTGKWVLWFNAYNAPSGYAVLTSDQPTGPFARQPFPRLGVGNVPASSKSNGAGSLFVDDDGTAYLAYTAWSNGGGVVVERLTSDYLSGTGSFTALDWRDAEAPSLFKHARTYFITYDDPGCAYCGGTGTAYASAPSASGPWKQRGRISDLSCDGQAASAVASIPTQHGGVFLFISDQWTNRVRPRPADWDGNTDLRVMRHYNQADATQHWEPLRFGAGGASLRALECLPFFAIAPV
ncbi:MAG: family 43 glycosylhydrolase [Chloroflexi bacterium]|nr:family 43 glycosylhydrolase [Chloroflexota bacterium]